MKITQVYEIVNSITNEILGESAVLKEDLSNIVEIGQAFEDASGLDAYTKSLVNHIGKVVFVDRKYSGVLPSMFYEAWEFGSVKEKINCKLPEATENESWELESGASYDENIFTAPEVSAKFFNKMVTFEIPMSITEMQVKQSFSSASQLNGFVSMIYTSIENAMTLKIDGLIMRGINNMIAETVHDDYGSDSIGSKSGVKAINLLKLYNTEFSQSLTFPACIFNADFVKYATYSMGLIEDRLKVMSTLYNIEGEERFTSRDMLHCILLSNFKKSADVYLQSDTFNENYTALPNAETLPYWQGSGTGYAIADCAKVYVKTASGNDVTVTGVLGVMFHRDAAMVANQDRRVTSKYNAKGEFTNFWHKWDCELLNDFSEEFVVFFAA